ncbi:purine-binding chemotaxis protein CheW [Candidatus Dependentiae bacterium]|nr:purine-binding chemotaxis protein CheW [Candidatus Dependentiae bacterium]
MQSKETLFTKSGGKLLTFFLDNREYGIQILEAREVVGMQNIDPVPRTPEFMKGVINLRGKIVPVIDLRLKFSMQKRKYDKDNCIIVVDLNGILTGVIVDQLAGVITIDKEYYEAAPKLGNNISAEFVSGMVKLDERVIIVLEIEKVLDNDEIEFLKKAT